MQKLLCAILLAGVALLVGCGGPQNDVTVDSASAPVAASSTQASRFKASAGMVSRSVTASPAVAADEKMADSAVPGSHGAAPAHLASATTPRASSRQVVRRAELSVRVKSVEAAEKQVRTAVDAVRGYLDSATSSDLASDNPKMDLTVRIPVESFDDFLAKVESFGVRLSKTVSSEDVTTQLVDLEARGKTLAAQEDTIRAMLRQARSLNTVIELQDKLTEIRTTIESLAAERKALGGLATLSTVKIHFEQGSQPVAPSKDPDWLAQSWGEASSTLGGIGRTAVVAGIWLFTFCPIWIPILWVVHYAYRTSKVKNSSH